MGMWGCWGHRDGCWGCEGRNMVGTWDRGQIVRMGEGDLGVGIGNMVGPQGGTGVRGGGDRRAKGTWGT